MSLLSTPLSLGKHTLRNRIVVPPMAVHGVTGEDGFAGEKVIAHYRALANGGAGLIVLEGSAVTPMKEFRGILHLYDEAALPSLTALADAIHSEGALSVMQLVNNGLASMEEETIAQIPRDTFLRYRDDFVSAAARCQRAGFDGVELHAAHGFYLNQIVEQSDRDDEFGGSAENRNRILVQLIHAIRQTCGADFLISVRFGNADADALQYTARTVQDAGCDLLSVSAGCKGAPAAPEGFPYDGLHYAASLVKQQARVPVIGVCGIKTVQQAQGVLAAGYEDLVAVGRAHLADPAWARKALSFE